jgi:GT2 family glycosyltransferase
MRKILVTIVTYNNENEINLLRKNIELLLKNNIYISIFDNNSTDETRNLLQKIENEYQNQNLIITYSSENYGWIKGHKNAIKTFLKLNKTFDYILLLNPDIEIIDCGFIPYFISIFEKIAIFLP